MQEDTAPSTPASNTIAIYSDSADSNLLKYKDDAGNVHYASAEWGNVPTTVLPTSDNGLDLGSAAKSWRTLYIDTSIVLGAAASKIVPGATSFAIRNNADSADNLIITDAGAATIRTSLTVTTSATVGGDLTVDTNVLKVDSGQNWVGVGTASPQAKLHVTETNSNFALIRMSNTANNAGEKNWEFITRDDGRFEIRSLSDAWDSVNSTPLAMEASTGYVGMGTTSPAGKLHIADTETTGLFWRGASIGSSPQTIATGFTTGVVFLYVFKHSGGGTMRGTADLALGGSVTPDFSTAPEGTFTFALSGGGALTVAWSGSGTASGGVWLLGV